MTMAKRIGFMNTSGARILAFRMPVTLVTSTKAVLLAILFTGMSVAIGVSTALYVGYRKAQEKLNVDGGTLRQAVTTFANFEETMHNIAGDEEGEFGKRAARLRKDHPFTPPANALLTQHQVEQFISVKGKLMEIDEEMAADMKREPSDRPSAGFLLKWNFFTRGQRLRMAQIEALEAQRMPLEEYNWVHLNLYTAMVSEGFKPEDQKADWAAEVQRTIDQSTQEIDRQLNDPGTTEARRAELRDLRATMAEGRETLTDATHALQKTLQSVPAENRQLVQRYRDTLAKDFVAGIDIEMVDIMRAIEAARAR
jgi:hypothetical protein